MHLQGIQGTDLQVHLIMQKFLCHRLEVLQHLFLLVHLFLGGRCKLLFLVISKDLIVYELQETRGKREQLIAEIQTRGFTLEFCLSVIVPCDQDVDKCWVSMELEGNVVSDPLVYALGRGVFLELVQQLLL